LNIRPATAIDVLSLLQLERASATAAHWSEAQYRRAVEPHNHSAERIVLVVEADAGTLGSFMADGRPALPGFLVARHVASEWELENIVVSPAYRRRSVATRLLTAFLERARETESHVVFLEVRESNHPARKLYQKVGFRETGRRKLYYSDPLEDAIVYSQEIV
jgi:[ribosomal protein S18]-alanine N-acetyltransferase